VCVLLERICVFIYVTFMFWRKPTHLCCCEQIPSPLSEDREAEIKKKQSDKKKAQRAARKEKERERKEEEARKAEEQDEKERFLALSDREKVPNYSTVFFAVCQHVGFRNDMKLIQ